VVLSGAEVLGLAVEEDDAESSEHRDESVTLQARVRELRVHVASKRRAGTEVHDKHLVV